MAWYVEITRPAEKDLSRIPDRDVRYIFNALNRLAEDPYNADIRKLSGTNAEWRLRVGNWRVRFVMESQTNTISIIRILPRGRAYRG